MDGFVSLQVDEMLKRRLGDEDALMAELTKTYSAEEDPILADLVSAAYTSNYPFGTQV